ncbi:hypothetical protein GALMADRAFT_248286 [Galerina marginata CBS 339.88]|uniref:Uncharacterized protein n=1 Tax=Galerina marginata (strain CBS 339.88) TaxID=685588 RepID=A0A067SXJ3_GALM3|nr:hypothetical protein GALMADRAFT_248286 [Galerina marginata CBS 339.88]
MLSGMMERRMHLCSVPSAFSFIYGWLALGADTFVLSFDTYNDLEKKDIDGGD